MRSVILGFIAFVFLASPPVAAVGAPSGPEGMLAWVYAYRASPNPDRVPGALHAMRKLNMLREQETEGAGFLIGFLAGVLGENPKKAERLVRRMFPMPAKEQGVIVKAIAYSGLPNWKALLRKFAGKMPERKAMIDEYLSGKSKVLMELPLKKGGTPLVYTLWGYYVATGSHEPLERIITALRWTRSAKDDDLSWDRFVTALGLGEDDVDLTALTIGSTAKWTLATQAEKDRNLLAFYRSQIGRQKSERVVEALKEIVTAGERFEAETLRKQELAMIKAEEQRLARQGNPLSRASYAATIALSGACVIAGATGHPEIAVPCVIVGVVYTGAQKLLQNGR